MTKVSFREKPISSSPRGEYFQEYYVRNKDHIRDYKRDYFVRNKDTIRTSMHDYYLRNKSQGSQEKRIYYIRNKDTIREYNREYFSLNKGKERLNKREYYIQNKDQIRGSQRKYYLKKRQEACLYHSDYRHRNVEKVRKYYIETKTNPTDYSPRLCVAKSWRTPETVREYFESVADPLRVSSLSDWYRISRPQVAERAGMMSVRIVLFIYQVPVY